MGKSAPSTIGRTAGRWAAAALAVGVVGILVYSVAQGLSKPKREDIDEPIAPDLTGPMQPIGEGAQAGAARGLRIQLVDRSDPARVAGEIIADAADPLPGRRYAIKAPTVWLNLKDGRFVYVRSDTGSFAMPDAQSQPESGLLRGDGLAHLFAPTASGQRPDAATATPLATARFTSLSFDTVLGELSTDERLVIQSEALDFAGTGVRLYFNQAKERVSRLEVLRGEFLRVRPARSDTANLAVPGPARHQPGVAAQVAADPGARAATPGASPTPSPPAVPVEAMYAAVINNQVAVRTRGAVVTGDRLDAWARLVDGALREGAVTPIKFGRAATKAERGETSDPGPIGDSLAITAEPPASVAPGRVEPERAEPILPSTVAARTPTASDPDEIELTWTGPMVVSYVEATPVQLAKDDVYARMTADQTGLVRAESNEQGAWATAAGLEYGATTTALSLYGPGPRAVEISAPEAGRVLTGRVSANLQTGLVNVPGPGSAHVDGSDRRISWNEQADLAFDVRRGAIEHLRSAFFRGDVVALDHDASIASDFLRGEFEPQGDGASGVWLKRLLAEGGFIASETSQPDPGTLAGETLQVDFHRTDTGSPRPAYLHACRGVTASDGDSSLTCEDLRADLGVDGEGRTVVDRAVATGSARFDRAARGKEPALWATADQIVAFPRIELAQLFVNDQSDAFAEVGQGGTRVLGRQIDLDGAHRHADVVGPGELIHAGQEQGPFGVTDVRVTWTGGMNFRDAEGEARAVGDVHVEGTSPLVRDTLDARLAILRMDPALAVGDAAQRSRGARRIVSVEAFGAQAPGEEATPARAESRRYLADAESPEGRRLGRLLYLEAPRLVSNNIDQTLDALGPGRLLSVDRESAPAANQEGFAFDSVAGSTLVRWTTSMALRRLAGRAEFRDNVELTHQSPNGERVFVQTPWLEAMFREESNGETSAPGAPGLTGSGQLISANARDGVFLRAGRRELAAGAMEYDAISRVIDAVAPTGGRLTLYDPAQVAPIRAGRIRWDLVKDVIEVINIDPVSTPRP